MHSKPRCTLRFRAFLGLALLGGLSACSTVPARRPPPETAMVRITMAGYAWEKSADAEAAFAAEIKTRDQLPFYAEVVLPNPTGKPEVIREKVDTTDVAIRAKGTPRKGWVNHEVYYYLLKIYSDPGYTHLLDISTESSVYQNPPAAAK